MAGASWSTQCLNDLILREMHYDWLQQSLQKLRLMTLIKLVIVSTLDITLMHNVIDGLCTFNICCIENVN